LSKIWGITTTWAVIALLLLTSPLWIPGASLTRCTSAETARCLRDPDCHRRFVVAHRGFARLSQWLTRQPENSRTLVRQAVQADIPLIEVDIRLSADDVPFVLHDSTLDRTTSCTGRIEDLVAAQLDACHLSNGESLPRFEEIYEITRGRAVLDLDLKADAVVEIVDRLLTSGSFDDAIFYVVRGRTIALAARAKSRIPQMLVMARATSDGRAADIEREFRQLGSRAPELIHIDYPFPRLFRPLVPGGARRFKIFSDSWVIPVLSVPWLRMVGVDVVESNDPAVVARLL
jgi:Glycerophosphoryl diester phosphodiesterase family